MFKLFNLQKFALACVVTILVERNAVLGSGTGQDLRSLGSHYAPSLRPWSIQDSISTAYSFGNADFPNNICRSTADGTLRSPDKKQWLIVSIKSNLSRDTNTVRLSVFSDEQIRTYLHTTGTETLNPLYSLEQESASADWHRPPMWKIRWSPDSEAITYCRDVSEDETAVWKWSCVSGKAVELVRIKGVISDYLSAGGRVVIDTMERPNLAGIDIGYPMQPLRQTSSGAIAHDLLVSETAASYHAKIGERAHRIQKAQLVLLVENWSISPSGDFAIGRRAVTHVPPSWEGYKKSGRVPYEFELYDFAAGEYKSVLNTPDGTFIRPSMADGSVVMSPRSLWIDERNAVLINTALPLAEAGAAGESRHSMPYVVSWNVVTGKWTPLLPVFDGDNRALVAAQWNASLRELHLQYRGNNVVDDVRFTWLGESWRELPSEAAKDVVRPAIQQAPIHLEIEQNQNTPPHLTASMDGIKKTVIAANPIFEVTYRSTWQTYTWIDSRGKERKGGLLLPRMQIKGKPLPLVVQVSTQPYSANEFWVEGAFAGAGYGAESFAASGFAVLNIGGENISTGFFSDGFETTDIIESGILNLVKAGLVDPDRVGLTGFSRGGYRVLFALTHAKSVHYRAGTCVDAYNGSFFTDLYGHAIGTTAVASKSFWSAPELWMKTDPIFNLQRLRAPILRTVHCGGGIFCSSLSPITVENIGAMAAAGKEMDLLIFPTGSHQLQRPRERLALLEANLDWMKFWLLEREDSDPSKAAQYERWHNLKADWERQQAWEAVGHPAGSIPDKDFKMPGTVGTHRRDR